MHAPENGLEMNFEKLLHFEKFFVLAESPARDSALISAPNAQSPLQETLLGQRNYQFHLTKLKHFSAQSYM
jgi:hypothetical protein